MNHSSFSKEMRKSDQDSVIVQLQKMEGIFY